MTDEMKRIKELGISPTPWSAEKSKVGFEVGDEEGFNLSYEDRYKHSDACLIAAAPNSARPCDRRLSNTATVATIVLTPTELTSVTKNKTSASCKGGAKLWRKRHNLTPKGKTQTRKEK